MPNIGIMKYKQMNHLSYNVGKTISKVPDFHITTRGRTKFTLSAEFNTSRDKKWLRFVEVNTTNRTIMLIESVDESPHPVIP